MDGKPRFPVAFYRERPDPKKASVSERTAMRIMARMNQTLGKPLSPEEVAWLNQPIVAFGPEPRPPDPVVAKTIASAFARRDSEEPRHTDTQGPW